MIQRVEKILSEDSPFLGTAVPYVTAVDSTGRPAETATIVKTYIDERMEFTAALATACGSHHSSPIGKTT